MGLIVALQHRPELLVLDEPTSGLDPLIQQEFFALVREAKAEGRTVFLSSHVISEVERTCDRAAIIRDGRLVRVDRVDALRQIAVHHVELRFAGPVPIEAFASLPGVRDVQAHEHTLVMQVNGPIAPDRARGRPVRARGLRQPRAQPRGGVPGRVRARAGP